MDERFVVDAPLPENLGRCADLYREVRDVRLAMQKEVDDVERREKQIKEHIIDSLSKSDEQGAVGLRYIAKIEMKTKYKVADWGVFHSWVRKNDRFDMLHKRLSDDAVREFAEHNQHTPPGTEVFSVPDVSITKR